MVQSIYGSSSNKMGRNTTKHFESLGKQNTGIMWQEKLQMQLMMTAWEMWMHRCNQKHKINNVREQMAKSELLAGALKELQEGPKDVPRTMHHLWMEYTNENLKDMETETLKTWFSLVESARRSVLPVPAEGDQDKETYMLECAILWQWIWTNRY
jgi:hypothetical protein